MKSKQYLQTFVLFLLFVACAGSSWSQGIIRGTVLDENGEPVIGASVVIFAQKTGASTNENGIFQIPKLPKGQHSLRVTYIGYDTTYKKVELPAGKTISVSMVIRESATYIDAVDITATKIGKIEKREFDIGKTKITPKQINLIPSLGTPDLAQYLQVLPGAVSTGDQGGQLYIRGGTPVMNMVLLDGAIIYNPFHSIGVFSVFDTDYIRGVDVYSAAFPSQYGGRVSAIMDVKTRNGNFKKFRGKANINPIAAGLLFEGPMGKPKKDAAGGNSFLVSARSSYLDKTSKVIYPYVNDSIGLPFNFNDLYAKTTFSDGLSNVNFFGFYQNDNVNYEFPSNFSWTQFGGGSNFQVLPGGSNLIFRGNFAYSSFESGLQSVSEAFPRRSLIRGFNGGLSFNYLVNSINEFSYGIQFLGFQTDYEFTNSFGLVTRQIFNNTEATGYFRWKKVMRRVNPAKPDSIIDRMVFEPGLHIHYYNDHSKIMVEPRFRYKLNLDRVSVTAGAGLYSQNLVSANSDRDVVNLFSGYLAAPPNLANRVKEHALQTAAHLLLGVEAELIPNLSTRVEGWYKDFTQLTNINRDKIFPDEPDFITERGKAYGIDLIARYETKKVYIYSNYGLAKVTRDDNIRTYPPVFDRRHNLNVVFAYFNGTLYGEDDKINGKRKFDEKKWEFSLRWNLGSGFPFTQTQGFFEKIDFTQDGAQTDIVNQNGRLGILYSEEINGGRLPYYHRLDLSAKRRWVIKNKMLIESNISLINVYNRQNVFYFDRVRFAVINQLPILPNLGLTVKF